MKPRSAPLNFEHFSLDPRILAGVSAAGYTRPTPIQQQAIPVVLEGRDVLGLAQTGTGKTAAFVLPILQRLTKGPLRRVRALVVAPTRELAEQIHQTIVDLGRNTRVRSVAIYGGVSKRPQVAALQRGAEIVVACPGRLLDHMGDGSIDLSQLDVLVVDEADMMCDMGFLPDIRRILAHLPVRRQILFFCATMPEEIRNLSHHILSDPATVQIGVIAPAKTVSHALYPVPEGLKTRLLLAMLRQMPTKRLLVFTRTKHRTRRLARALEEGDYRVTALQGNIAQNRRQDALDGFRDGTHDILVATDIASRGIDVSKVSHVINFDMPATVDAYTHRIGRTGRAQHIGRAFTFTTMADEPLVFRIEKVLKTRIERIRLPGFDYSSPTPASHLPQSNGDRPSQAGLRRNGVQERPARGPANPPANNGASVAGAPRRRRKRLTPRASRSQTT